MRPEVHDPRRSLRVVAITDRRLCRGGEDEWLDRCVACLEGGATALLVREKDLPARELYDLLGMLLPQVHAMEATLLVSDRVDVAIAAGAHGVHLAQHSLPPGEARALLPPRMLLGVSCHNDGELFDAAMGMADYVFLSPVFETISKQSSLELLGLDGLERLVRLSELPAVALGGVTAQNAHHCLEAGAVGVASIGALFGANDPRTAAGAFVRIFGS